MPDEKALFSTTGAKLQTKTCQDAGARVSFMTVLLQLLAATGQVYSFFSSVVCCDIPNKIYFPPTPAALLELVIAQDSGNALT